MDRLYLTVDCVEEIDAQRVFGYALFKDGKNTRLSYPLEKFHSDVSGRSFHNGRFIQRMREKAATLPKYIFTVYFWSLNSDDFTNFLCLKILYLLLDMRSFFHSSVCNWSKEQLLLCLKKREQLKVCNTRLKLAKR